MSLFNGLQISTNDSFTKRKIESSCSQVVNSLIQIIYLESLQWTELTSKNRENLWAHADAQLKSKLLMLNFRINYCDRKSYLGQNLLVFCELNLL